MAFDAKTFSPRSLELLFDLRERKGSWSPASVWVSVMLERPRWLLAGGYLPYTLNPGF